MEVWRAMVSSQNEGEILFIHICRTERSWGGECGTDKGHILFLQDLNDVVQEVHSWEVVCNENTCPAVCKLEVIGTDSINILFCCHSGSPSKTAV